MSVSDRARTRGLCCAVAAFLIWGLLPLFWDVLREIPAAEIFLHRMVWAFVMLTAVVIVSGDPHRLFVMGSRHWRTLVVTAILIGSNWSFFIWAITHHHVLDASLGYFISPILNVLVGVRLLGERLSRLQMFACVSALVGCAGMIYALGAVPWVALTLAGTFLPYSYIRKTIDIGSLDGLTIECALLLPVALGSLWYLHVTGADMLPIGGWPLLALFVLGGILSTIPLLLFIEASRNLPLSVLGFIQYLSPFAQFVLGISYFHEGFDVVRGFSFLCIWIALMLISIDQYRNMRRESSANG